MEWVMGIQKAVDYIEEHLTEPIDYDMIAAQGFSSKYHFQRVFSILCGFTIGEYIRDRRLTLAGAELVTSDARVLDIALKYGYESPDSFAKAFRKFHGVLPSQARSSGSGLKSVSRLVLNITLEGGSKMNYRIEEKPEMILTGYKMHFFGAPYGKERQQQEERLFLTTRGKQWFLRGASGDRDAYCVISNITDQGYDYYYCHLLGEWERQNLYNREVTGVDFVADLGLETITIPKATYGVFVTTEIKGVICDYFRLLNRRIQILTEWLPEMGFQLAEGPELAVYHWLPKTERRVEVWMPIEKIGSCLCSDEFVEEESITAQ